MAIAAQRSAADQRWPSRAFRFEFEFDCGLDEASPCAYHRELAIYMHILLSARRCAGEIELGMEGGDPGRFSYLWPLSRIGPARPVLHCTAPC